MAGKKRSPGIDTAEEERRSESIPKSLRATSDSRAHDKEEGLIRRGRGSSSPRLRNRMRSCRNGIRNPPPQERQDPRRRRRNSGGLHHATGGSLSDASPRSSSAALGGDNLDVPLFSWSKDGVVRPVTRSSFLKRVNGILVTAEIDTTFGHSLRIGGATFYPSEGMEVEFVHIAGRWKSLAFELYIHLSKS